MQLSGNFAPVVTISIQQTHLNGFKTWQRSNRKTKLRKHRDMLKYMRKTLNFCFFYTKNYWWVIFRVLYAQLINR